MKYPELLRLRVARRHRSGLPDNPPEGAELLRLLRSELAAIEKLANELRSVARKGPVDDYLDRLRRLMSLDAKPLVLDARGEWHKRLLADVRHDGSLLDSLLERSASETWCPPDPANMKEVARKEIPDEDVRAAAAPDDWLDSLLAGSLWMGHIIARLEEKARRFGPANAQFQQAELTQAEVGPGPCMATVATCHTRPEFSVHVRPGAGVLEATLWFRLENQEKRSPRGFAWSASDRKVWGALFVPGPGRRVCLLAEIAAMLQQAAMRRSQLGHTGDLDELRLELKKFAGKDPTDLLCRIAVHLFSLSAADEVDANAKLLGIVSNSSWSSLMRCLATVVRRLKPGAVVARDIYSAMWNRSPIQPEICDLVALADAAVALGVDNPRRAFVGAVCSSTLAEAVAQAAGAPMRKMLALLDPGHELRSVVDQALADAVAAPLGGADVLNRLDQLGMILSAAHPSAEETAALMVRVRPKLVERLTVWPRAAWPTEAETAWRVEGIARFRTLAGPAQFGASDLLAWAQNPLPVSGGGPAAYPPSFWPLMHTWLSGAVVDEKEKDAYRAEVARLWLDWFCRGAATADQLRGCARWLGPRLSHAVAQNLVNAWVLALEESAQKAVEALRLLRPGDQNQPWNSVVSWSVRIRIWRESPAPWRDVLVSRWLAALKAIVAGGAWLSEWAALAVLGVLYDPEHENGWTEFLFVNSPAVSEQDWDLALAGFGSNVQSGAVAVQQAEARVSALEAVGRVSRAEWRTWRTDAASFLAADVAFRLRLAALAVSPAPLHRTVADIWPSAACGLLPNRQDELFGRLAKLIESEGLYSETLRDACAEALLDPALPQQPWAEAVSMMVRVLYDRSLGTVPANPELSKRWYSLNQIAGLDPKWKLNLARHLFGADGCAVTFDEALRYCIGNVSNAATRTQLCALVAMI